MATAGVDFFRVDRSGAVRRRLSLAGALVLVGSTAIGSHLVHRLDSGFAHLISLAGGLTTIVGLILGFGAMAIMLFEDVYLLLREDGVLVYENGKEIVIAWNDLARISLAPGGFVLLEVAEGREPLRWYAGRAAPDVRKRIEDARRKALHGLLKTSSSRPPSARA